MHPVKDTIHDHIDVDEVAADLVDTRPVQRLRHVRQLSTVQFVYPSANHTRFEHSLGVYHLASKQLDYLDRWRESLPPGRRDDETDWRRGVPADHKEREHVLAAALLHDVGHGPFGHQTEPVIERHLGRGHQDVRDVVTDGGDGARRTIRDVLQDHALDPDVVVALVEGEPDAGPLVSGPVDVDRMDYLLRDRHHTGVEFGGIEAERLLRRRVYEGEPVLPAENVAVAT